MNLIKKIESAGVEGFLLDSSVVNLKIWASSDLLPEWVIASITELVEEEEWEELNDRFYQNMTFGTGGIRGRTIGKISTSVECGKLSVTGTPEHAAVGTNALNDFNLIKVIIGLYRYSKLHLETCRRIDQPRIIIAHDVRHFSRHFCELAASTWTKMGGQALIFDGPRSTPQLSFAVRQFKATCGAVITASHNPSHDNGFKAYFEDGAQVISEHAKGIVDQVNSIVLEELCKYLDIDLSGVVVLGEDADTAYINSLSDTVIDSDLIKKYSPKVVFSPIHGCGAISSVPLLKSLGVEVIEVAEQMNLDGRFPTVQSPNPENAEALEMAIAKADEVGADVVIATDPDADRMGVAVRDGNGDMVLLSGNQTGTILSEYRISTLKEAGILPEQGSENAVLIKTFVTTPMQEAVATWHGLKTINTLTGFKWMGAKLSNYEENMKNELFEKEGMVVDYDSCDIKTKAELMLEYSNYFVFGNEESYGYLASDSVRDKDANSAVIMFCELAAYLRSKEMNFIDYLNLLYLKHGYYQEETINIYYEGAAGSRRIKSIIDSYRSDVPQSFGGFDVTNFIDFGKDEIFDADGERIPFQEFYFFELSNGYSFAVRASGTEPKIKFYAFGRSELDDLDKLDKIKVTASKVMQSLLIAIEADARKRADS